MNGVGELLNLLQNAKTKANGQWQANCPAHPDTKGHLYIKQEADKVLVKCQHGCSTEAICEALHITLADLFIKADAPVKAAPASAPRGQIVATYDYVDESGKPLFQVVRMEPKDFRQRHKNGGGEWVWNLDGCRRVLYHLPQVLASDTVYLVEGEKDADNLCKCGLCATTNPGGAGAWKDEYADVLKGKLIIIIPDKDAAGMEAARQRASSLKNIAETMTIILPGPTVKDASDWLAQGGNVADLPGIALGVEALYEEAAVEYREAGQAIVWTVPTLLQDLRFRAEKVSEERSGIHARVSLSLEGRLLGWSYLNIERSEDRVRLGNSCHAQIQGELAKKYTKENLRRDLDRFCEGLWMFKQSLFMPEDMAGDASTPISFALNPYILDDGGTVLFAAPGRGKSYTLLLWMVSVDAGQTRFWNVQQRKVLFINLERSKQSLQRRLAKVNLALGLPENRPLATLNARGKALFDVAATCRTYIADKGIQMVALDSISRAGYGDLNENQPVNKIVDCLSALCPTWVALAHTSRASEDHAYGSIMLDAGADICVQLSSEMKPDDNLLGVCWTITKQNDLGFKHPERFALHFDEAGLTSIRGAKDGEFPELEGKDPRSKPSQIADWLADQDSEDGTATQIADALGFRRDDVSRILSKNKNLFEISRKVRQSVFYRNKPKTEIPKAFEY